MAHQFSASARRRAPLFLALMLAGCGGGGTGTTSVVTVTGAGSPVAVTPTPTPTPAATPTQTPTATPVVTPTLAGLDPVASGVNVAAYLQASWGNGAIPETMAPDVVGAFRFMCVPSHNAYDDPIVFPGRPGASHLHTFFGNTKADGNSTYASLRTTGESTCNNLLNRSAYWMPAMMNGRGKVVMPKALTIYYKRRPASDPECQHQGTACVPMPRGLRFVFGYNMGTGALGNGYFTCDDARGPNGSEPNIARAAKGCPVGATISAHVDAPSCWNGTELDSADHRSHLSYPSYGNWGYPKCPATHPYIIPQFILSAAYVVDESLDQSGDESATANTWYYASDRMAGMTAQVPGTTLHADWFGAWEDSIMDLWTANCIDKLLSCSGGDLGNGQQLTLLSGYNYASNTVLVDPPVHP